MLSSARFAPHTPNFLGALSKTHGEPQTRPVCAVYPLTIEGVLPPAVRLVRVFDRLIAAPAIAYTAVWVGPPGAGEMGG